MDEKMKKGFPAWYTISFLGFLGILNNFSMCFLFNIVFYSLVKAPINTYNNKTDGNYSNCPEITDENATEEINIQPEFSWDFKTQRIILESSFYGFCLTQIPAGILSDVYGGKWPFGISVLVTAFLCLLIPSVARINEKALISATVFQGMASGMSLPSINTLLAKWVPKMERSIHYAVVLNGILLSNIYTYVITGFLLKNEFFGGWSSVFYLQGTISVVWFFFWSILIYESPDDHQFLSESEIKQLRKSQHKNEDEKVSLNIKEIPWKTVMTSTKMWALIVAHSGYYWNFATLIIELPIYFAKVLKFDLIRNSLECSIVFGASAVFGYSSGILTDALRRKNCFFITTIRKVMNSLAFFVPALCLILIPFIGCGIWYVICLQLFAYSFMGAASSGFQVTHIDMCPELAGILVAITGTFGSLFGCFAILFNNLVVNSVHSLKSWQIVFCTSGAVLYISGMIYNYFADAEEQDWITNLNPSDENTEASEEKE